MAHCLSRGYDLRNRSSGIVVEGQNPILKFFSKHLFDGRRQSRSKVPREIRTRAASACDNEVMNNRTFETQDLRIRIEDNIVRIDQRRLDGELWREIDHSDLPVSQAWLMSPIRTSPLRVALSAFERENPGDMTLRKALES
jgi:hypothetical protein